MSGRRRILFSAERAMISDGAIVSGLLLTAIAGDWMSKSKERSCVDGKCGTAGIERSATRAA